MDRPTFVYVTYIASTPEKVWDALLDPQTTAKSWQHENLSDWRPGSPWKHRRTDENRSVDLVARWSSVRGPGGSS